MFGRLVCFLFGCSFNIVHVCEHNVANGVGKCIWCRREKKRCRECRVQEHCMKKALSWSIETQNDKTKFMDDFEE